MNNKTFSINASIEQLQSSQLANESIILFTCLVIKEKKNIVGATSHKYYSYQVYKLKAFRKYFSLPDIDLIFIRNYDDFLKNEFGNKKNT